MANIADSWGDEPRDLWPEEIKAKYPDSTPPTLEQTINHIMAMLEWMKDAIGFPALPRCDQKTDSNDPVAVQQEELNSHQGTCQSRNYEGSGFPPLPGCLHLPDISPFDLRNDKRRLYNLAQVASVLRENLPSSGTPKAGGMKLLRNLFFQLFYSTPLNSRSSLDGMKNNLSLMRFFVESGISRQLSFELRRYQRNDPALRDFFGALVEAGDAPSASELFDRLLVRDKSRTLLWSIAERLYPYMGNSLAEGEVRKDSLYFKQSAIEGLALLREWNLIEPALKALSLSLSDQSEDLLKQFTEMLSQVEVSHLIAALNQEEDSPGKESVRAITSDFFSHPELISDALGVFNAVDSDPTANAAMRTVRTRWNDFRLSSEYRSLQLSPLGQEFADFVDESAHLSLNQLETARALRIYFAQRLENGDVDELLSSFASNPEKTEQTFEMLAKYLDNGAIVDLLAYIQRSVNTPPPRQ